MSTHIKSLFAKAISNRKKFLGAKPKEWLWFFALWLFGLFAVLTLTYPIKFLFSFLK